MARSPSTIELVCFSPTERIAFVRFDHKILRTSPPSSESAREVSDEATARLASLKWGYEASNVSDRLFPTFRDLDLFLARRQSEELDYQLLLMGAGDESDPIRTPLPTCSGESWPVTSARRRSPETVHNRLEAINANPAIRRDRGTQELFEELAAACRARQVRGAGQTETGYWFEPSSVTLDLGGTPLTLETGRMAKQAAGATVVTYGGTVVLVTAAHAGPRPGQDFFPLTVDFVEKTSAAGKIPGGFFKREARLSDREILVCRFIDRSIRPLWRRGLPRRDPDHRHRARRRRRLPQPDMCGLHRRFDVRPCPSRTCRSSARSAALRVGKVEGQLDREPDRTSSMEESPLELVVAGSRDGARDGRGQRPRRPPESTDPRRAASSPTSRRATAPDGPAGRARGARPASPRREVPAAPEPHHGRRSRRA